jgi:hypothetical protein
MNLNNVQLTSINNKPKNQPILRAINDPSIPSPNQGLPNAYLSGIQKTAKPVPNELGSRSKIKGNRFSDYLKGDLMSLDVTANGLNNS